MIESMRFIIRFENGECAGQKEVIKGFQLLLDKGYLFKLQGTYSQIGTQLLKQGLIEPKDGQ